MKKDEGSESGQDTMKAEEADVRDVKYQFEKLVGKLDAFLFQKKSLSVLGQMLFLLGLFASISVIGPVPGRKEFSMKDRGLKVRDLTFAFDPEPCLRFA